MGIEPAFTNLYPVLTRTLSIAAALVIVPALTVAAGLALHLAGLAIWMMAAVMIAATMVAVSFTTAWRPAGIVAAALLLGNAAQLALTQPIWFPTVQLHPRAAFLPDYALILAQLVVTLFCLRASARGLWLESRATFGIGALSGLVAAMAVSTVAIMPAIANHDPGSFVAQSIAQIAFALLNAMSVLAFVVALPSTNPGAITRLAGHRVFAWIVAVFVLGVTLLLAVTAFGAMPRLPDEVAYLFQAKYFALGQLSLPAPPAAATAALRYDWISILHGKWYAIFPPGWPAVLALGVAVGLPVLVNPMLAALAILLADRLLRRLDHADIAPVAILLLATSPWYLALGASLMSHMLTLVLMLGGWLLLTVRGKTMIPAALGAGLLLGWLFLTRPMEGIIAGVLLGLWLTASLDLRKPAAWIAVLAYGFGCLAIGGLVFAYNQHLTGQPMLTPIDEYFDRLWHKGANRLGFGSDIGPPDAWGGIDLWPGHSPLEALVDAQYNLASLNTELLGWRMGSLVLVLVHMIWGRRSALDWWMTAIIGATAVAYGLYWFNGAFYIGPRYWFLMIFPLVFLSARGVLTLIARLESAGVADASGRVGLGGALLAFVALAVFLPWRGTARYWEYRNFHSDFRLAERANRNQAPLVFVKTGDMGDFGSAFALNRPDLGGALFLQTQGAQRDRAVIQAFPGRPVRYMLGRLGQRSRRAGFVSAEQLYRLPQGSSR